MRSRSLLLLGLGLLLLGVGLFWWRQADRPRAGINQPLPAAAVRSGRSATTNHQTIVAATAPLLAAQNKSATNAPTDPLKYRLANTTRSSEQLLRDDHALLLENALIDSRQPLGFNLPERLRLAGEPGSYIVQSRGPLDAAFRQALAEAGAEYVSYIPNNAWLVRATKEVAARLAANPETQSVLPWEPVYKLKAELLVLAMEDKPLPPDAKLNLLIFNGAQGEVLKQLQQLQTATIAEDRSPFGTVVTVSPGEDWLALARLPGVQLLERAYPRARANDLTRARIGVAQNSRTTTNYLGLTGTNVLLSINDFGVDGLHPDFNNPLRLTASSAGALVDTEGHGTHVAGIMAGSGFFSTNVLNARGSINPATNFQFRGMAPAANLYVQLAEDDDADLQERVALTNALISNNSWVYLGSSTYSLAAASYDAAVRDSLPGRPGSQPVLYVFAAGNAGDGTDVGLGGSPGTVMSPATSKNSLSVGAVELLRDITNEVERVTSGGSTNKSKPWQAMTSSDFQVAGFSSRGNVGIRIEGDYGRFKPDVVAPGTFVVAPRSTTWDQVEYYSPTSHFRTILQNQIVADGGFNRYPIYLPENTVGFSIQLLPNDDSPVPFPNLPLYVRRDGIPSTTTFDLRRTNSVSVPPDLGGVGTAVDQNWFFGVSNPTSEDVSYDILANIIVTNDYGNYLLVLSNLNNSLSSTNLTSTNFYRYESGTSMATPAVSGMLGLMQEFFEQRLLRTNSPALMKALTINGARTVANIYDFQVRSTINYQGWGLVNLPNSLPNSVSNAFNLNPDSVGAIKLIDQSPTNSLATGQSHIRFVSLTNELGRTVPLRITLVWTDPAANPAAGVKLVNDLDLVVTNLDTGDIYLGNDFPTADPYNNFWDTNEPPVIDSVNNVENVYLSPFLGTNYSITVSARRVNVNAVTAHTNDVVQDYALVISAGNGEIPDAFAISNQVFNAPLQVSPAIFVTNTINQPNDFVASFLENQRVGANTPLQLSTNAGNGMTNQWQFFVVTNTTSFTNAAFLISQQTDLATPRIGVRESTTDEATRRYADLDLYVKVNDFTLTNLNPVAISGSVQSRSRNDLSGDEFVIFTNSVNNDIYYVGVKSEDQMAAQFDFFAIFSLLPLGAEDGNGFVRAYPMTGTNITEGPPSNPGGARFVAITVPSTTGDPQSVRRVIITNSVSHDNIGDLINSVDHNSRVVILDNHRSIAVPPPPGPYNFLYDDSGEGDYLNSIPTDGPGSLNNFQGETPGGTWYFTFSDDALSQVGSVNDVRIRIERQCESDCSLTNTIAPNSWRYFTRNIPVEATNFTVCINIISPSPEPLQLYIRKEGRPTTTLYDFTRVIPVTGGCLTIDRSTLPPLQAGRYFIGVFNPNATSQDFVYTATVLLGPTPTPTLFSGNTGTVPLLDDAVTNYTQFITNDAFIAQVDVGLRVDHPRVSDLAVTLVSPRGTRVLLVENRGGTNTGGFGSTLSVTNFTPVGANGGAAGQTNLIDTGSPFGTVTIDYNFFDVADQMTVHYQGALLFDTGMTNGTRQLTLNYGPGTSTVIEVRMNEFGNADTNTAWSYSASSINNIHNYLTFTDNTNFTTTPIKFAPAPFTTATNPLSTTCIPTNVVVMASGFESPALASTNCPAGFALTGNIEGWQVNFGDIDLLHEPCGFTSLTSDTGFQCIDLSGNVAGQVATNFPTVVGNSYVLSFAYTKNPSVSPGFIANASVDITGTPLFQISYGSNNTPSALGWAHTSVVFTASSPTTTLRLTSLNSGNGGMFVDSFKITTVDTVCFTNFGNYVLPEESLKALQGENAFGEWKIEFLDTRTGEFNNVALLDWQLRFIFQADVAEPTVIDPGTLITNTVCAGQIAYYVVDVPTWVRAATNQLFFATGPLNVYFNQNIRPTGTNTVPPDFDLLVAQTNGIVTLTTNVPAPVGFPVLAPGQRYYLGIENPSTNTCVTFGFVVDFDLNVFPPVVNLSNNVPYCTVNPGPAGTIDYYRFVVSSNSVRAQFQLFNLNGDLTVLVRRGLPPTFGVFDYLSANVFTNDEVITIFDYTQPVPLAPGEWYIGAANVFGPPISYCIKANEWAVYGTNIVITNTFLATNSFCLTWTTLPGATYTVEGVTNLSSTNWANVSGTITAADYSTTFCVALPSPFQFFRVREGVSLSTYVPPPVFSTIRRTFRGVELTWGGPVTARYQVEWSPTLVPATWTAFPLPPQVTSTTGLFQFLDDGSQSIPPGFGAARYYRLVLLP